MANFLFVSTKQTKLTGSINKRQEEKLLQSTRQDTKGHGAHSLEGRTSNPFHP